MRNRIRETTRARAARARLFGVSSVASPRSEDLAKGKRFLASFFLRSRSLTASFYYYFRYIKELADRIHSIENKLESEGGLTQDDVERLFAPETHRASNAAPGDDPSRKRPFSSISTGDYSTPTPARQTPWGSEQRPLQPAGTPPDNFAVPYSENSLAPRPSSLKPEGTPSKAQEPSMDISMTDGEEQPDIDEEVLQT